MGPALMGSLRISGFSTEGAFVYCHEPAFVFPKVPGRTFFPQPVKTRYFCSGHISVDPICPQPTDPWAPFSTGGSDKN